MVEFCPDCSNLLRRQLIDGTRILVCRCGFQKDFARNVEDVQKDAKLKEEALNKNLIVVTQEDKISVHPHVKKFCPKCTSKEAEAWQEQTRSGDEPSTSFFRCVECKHTWREY